MRKNMMLSLGVLLSFMLAAGAYAGQGQTGFGGVSGQASADDLDMKSGSAAQPAPAPAVAPTKNVRPATASDPNMKKDSPPTVSKKKSKRVAKSSDTEMKATTHTTSTTVSPKTPPRPAMSADSSVKSGSAAKRVQSAKVASGTTGKSATSTERNTKPVSPAQPVATAPIPPSIPLGAATLEGEVLRINGDSYIVKDVSGKNVRLQVDKDTKVGSNISTHDMVEVHASEVSSAKSPKAAWHADSIEKR